MPDIIFRPMTTWPGPKTKSWEQLVMPDRRTLPAVLKTLATELDSLVATDIVLETYHRGRDIRMDSRGLLSGAARPSETGVVLYFVAGKMVQAEGGRRSIGPQCHFCDTYEDAPKAPESNRGWIANIRAIALTLEALRGIDRWGTARTGQQYAGFAALPPPRELTPLESAARTLLQAAGRPITETAIGEMLADFDIGRSVYAVAVKVSHPDQGGTRQTFESVREAWAQLSGKDR